MEAYNERAEVPSQGIDDMFVGKVSKEQIINEIRKAFNYGQSEQDTSTPTLTERQSSGSSGSEQGSPIGTSHSESERSRVEDNPKPIGKGVFGNIYDQFKGKVKAAIEFLQRLQDGEALAVLHHKDIGDISLVWGTEKAGLKKILRKHPEVVDDLQNVLDEMQIVQSSDNRIVFESNTHKAVISKKLGNKETTQWLLTAYEKRGKVSGGSSDINPEPIKGKQNGTAPLQNVSSTDKDTNKSNIAQAENGKANKYDGRKSAPNVDNNKEWKPTPHHDSEVQNHDWSQYKSGDIFDNDGYKYRLEYVSRDENGYVDGVVVRHIDENGKLGVNEKLFPLMFIEGFKKVSDQGKADIGRTDSERAANDTPQEYTYQLTQRPYGIGSQPEGQLRHVDDGSKFGSVVYDHPLSEEEVKNFSLTPITEAKALEGRTFEVPFGDEKDVYHVDKVDDDGTIHYHVNDEAPLQARYHDFLSELGDEAKDVKVNLETGDEKIRYQKANKTAQVSESEVAAREVATHLVRKALGDDSVITDVDFGQRVLDEANGKARKMSFGEPYDYEKYPRGRVEPNLAEKSVSVVEADANHGFTNYKEAKSWAKQNISKTYYNEETGGKGTVRISNAAIDKFLSQSAIDKSESKDVHMSVLKVLPEVLKTSIDVETHPDFLKGENGKRNAENGINKDVLVHRCYGAVSIDGKPYRVKITLKEDPRDLSFPHITHSYEATKIELLEGTWENQEGPSPNTNNSITAAKLLNGVEMSYNSGKKLLAESKKRSETIREQRVFHGSGADFDHFDHSHMGEGEGAQAYGWGTYVTEVEGIGRTYAEENARYEPNDYDTEEAHGKISDEIERHYGVDGGMDLVYGYGNGGFEELSIKRDKAHLEKWQKYFSEHEDEFDSWDRSADDFDLNDESDVEDFAEIVERSINDYAVEVANKPEIQSLLNGLQRHLYTVEIPDDNGHNYLDWVNYVPKKTLEAVKKELKEYIKFGIDDIREDLGGKEKTKNYSDDALINAEFENALHISKYGEIDSGQDLYNRLKAYFGSQEEASRFLSNLGLVGIKYPADYRSGGRFDEAKNYVIFNEKDAKISDHIRYFRTPNGEAYGFTLGGKIYIDPRVATAETPIHEYSHLWATAMQKGNPKEWENIVGLMKGTSVWEEVKKAYPELTDDSEIADEVLAHYSGRQGAERLREEMRKATEGNGSPLDKAKAVSALQKVKVALDKFWKGVADFLHIHYTTAEEVADRVMKDLLDGVDPRKFGVDSKVREQFIGERGAKESDHAEEVTTRLDNLGVAREMEAADKDAKAIKMATGWERGADGKWRYEIPDGKYFPKGNAEYEKVKSKQPWSKELDLLTDRIFDGEELSAEESKRFEELANEEAKFKAEYLTREKPYLANWLKNDALFKAYPDLKSVELVFTDSLPEDTRGYYSERENKIVVNTKSDIDTESIIAHEVQHAIQHIEGFARGGSPETIRKQIEDYIRDNEEDVEMTKSTIDSAFNLFAKATKLEIVYPKMINSDVEWQRQTATDAYWDALNTIDNGFRHFDTEMQNDYSQFKGMSPYEIAKTGYHMKEAIAELKRMSDEYLNSLTDDDRELEELVDRYKKALKSDSDAILYRKLGGEVEARNVQSRMPMSPEERRQSLASETEDVAREDQIFLFGEGGSYNVRASDDVSENTQPLLNAIHTLYEKGKDFAAKLFNMKFFDVAKTPDFMKGLGLTGDKFTIRYGVISRHFGKDGSHQFTEEEWKQLPLALERPFAITKLKDKKNGYRVYTTLKTTNGEYMVVGADVKNAGKNLEVNSIATIFGRRNNANLTTNEDIIFTSKEITLEQKSLLSQPNSDQYTSNRELSTAKVENNPDTEQPLADENQAKRDTATRLTSAMHLDGSVEVVETSEGLEGRKRNAKGWYDSRTGKITVVLGNHESAADVQKTIFHEAVAHKGLRTMVGEENFDTFIEAQSTADFISAKRPKVVTIENVKGYKNSEALKIITDELTKQGYDWDMDVYNTADYGGYTKRERLIVRAVRDGKLPEKPQPLPESERRTF